MVKNEAWLEMDRQAALIHSLGQVTCGRTTHEHAKDCGYCGAAR